MVSNITEHIKQKVGRNLHMVDNHPLAITKSLVCSCFSGYDIFEDLRPEVSVENNFDALLIPLHHPSRSLSDTFYLDDNTVLRTHTSAHQSSLLAAGYKNFLVCGDVYRRDEVDRTHYPVFHQIEGVCICDNPVDKLKTDLAVVCQKLFPNCQYRIVDSYFPFTEPSFEIEVLFDGRWLEILGCGVIRQEILRKAGVEGTGYAFGMGLERLAMVLFDIPDIRYFWTDDPRFLSQFAKDKITKFKPYSNYPVCYKDITFWLSESYSPTDFYTIVREVAGDLVESIELVDEFSNAKGMSHCYRINYRHLNRSLTNDEINQIQTKIRELVEGSLNCRLR